MEVIILCLSKYQGWNRNNTDFHLIAYNVHVTSVEIIEKYLLYKALGPSISWSRVARL